MATQPQVTANGKYKSPGQRMKSASLDSSFGASRDTAQSPSDESIVGEGYGFNRETLNGMLSSASVGARRIGTLANQYKYHILTAIAVAGAAGVSYRMMRGKSFRSGSIKKAAEKLKGKKAKKH